MASLQHPWARKPDVASNNTISGSPSFDTSRMLSFREGPLYKLAVTLYEAELATGGGLYFEGVYHLATHSWWRRVEDGPATIFDDIIDTQVQHLYDEMVKYDEETLGIHGRAILKNPGSHRSSRSPPSIQEIIEKIFKISEFDRCFQYLFRIASPGAIARILQNQHDWRQAIETDATSGSYPRTFTEESSAQTRSAAAGAHPITLPEAPQITLNGHPLAGEEATEVDQVSFDSVWSALISSYGLKP